MKERDFKADNKLVIRFVVIMVVLYLVFSQGNLFMNSVVSPGGRYHNAFIETHLNYIQALRIGLIKPAVGLINLFGFYAIHNGQQVLVINGPMLNINYSCLGLGMMSFILAFVIAFPAPTNRKLQIILRTFLTVFILNILRIAGLGVLLASLHSQRQYFKFHHEVFNIFIYLVVLYLFYRWLKKMNNRGEIDY